MRPSVRDAARIGISYAGTVIGAGFASGQELAQFFVAFGTDGLAGIVLAGVLFAWFGTIILDLGHNLGARGYHEILRHVTGRRFGSLLDAVVALFLFCLVPIMYAGAGAVAADAFGLPRFAGSAFLAVAATLTALRGADGVIRANVAVLPALAAAITGLSVYSLWYHATGVAPAPAAPGLPAAPNWALAAVLYVAYNVTLGATILAPLGARTPDPLVRRAGGLLGGLILAVMGFLVAAVLLVHPPEVARHEVPLLLVSRLQHGLAGASYAVMLVLAMFTTAIAGQLGCGTKLQAAAGLPYAACVIGLSATGLALSQFGFSRLIAVLFPLFGYGTLAFLVSLLLASFRGNSPRSAQRPGLPR